MSLDEFNQQYQYISDLKKYNTSLFDIWEIPEQENGIYYGDCESYCRFLKANIPEFKEWDYYYCKLNGIGHCILVLGNSVIDCNTKRIVSLDSYKTMYNVTELKKYNLILVYLKIAFSKGFLLWKRFWK